MMVSFICIKIYLFYEFLNKKFITNFYYVIDL